MNKSATTATTINEGEGAVKSTTCWHCQITNQKSDESSENISDESSDIISGREGSSTSFFETGIIGNRFDTGGIGMMIGNECGIEKTVDFVSIGGEMVTREEANKKLVRTQAEDEKGRSRSKFFLFMNETFFGCGILGLWGFGVIGFWNIVNICLREKILKIICGRHSWRLKGRSY